MYYDDEERKFAESIERERQRNRRGQRLVISIFALYMISLAMIIFLCQKGLGD